MASVMYARSRRRERGAALVEFALVLPLLLVVLAGIVDFAFLFQRYEVVTNAAREGARLGSLPNYTDDAVRGHVRNYIQQGLALTDAQLNAAVPNNSTGVNVQGLTVAVPITGGTVNLAVRRVTVTYSHNFIMLGPILGLIGGTWGNAMNVVATSQMRLEVAGSTGS